MLLVDRTQPGENGMRYELYETMTGGDSWMLRQASSRPIQDARAFPAPRETGWRLRADAASRSYRLERREGERPIPVASFHRGRPVPSTGTATDGTRSTTRSVDFPDSIPIHPSETAAADQVR